MGSIDSSDSKHIASAADVKKSLKGIKKFLLFIGVLYGGVYFLLAEFVGPELPTLFSGIIGMIGTVLYVKFIKIETPDKSLQVFEDRDAATLANKTKYTGLQAFSIYIMLMIALPVIRFTVPLSFLVRYGYATWVGTVIIIVTMIGTMILGISKDIPKVAKETFFAIIPAFITMTSLLTLANVMKSTGMIVLIAEALAVTGWFYPFVAVFIGLLAAFMTGTALGSNLMFGPLHMEAAAILNMSPPLIFAANSVGGALGNMICPNNVVAVCTTVGELGKEGEVIKRVLLGWFILVVLYGCISMLYVHVLFPTLGM